MFSSSSVMKMAERGLRLCRERTLLGVAVPGSDGRGSGRLCGAVF